MARHLTSLYGRGDTGLMYLFDLLKFIGHFFKCFIFLPLSYKTYKTFLTYNTSLKYNMLLEILTSSYDTSLILIYWKTSFIIRYLNYETSLLAHNTTLVTYNTLLIGLHQSLIICQVTFRDCRVRFFSDTLSRNSCVEVPPPPPPPSSPPWGCCTFRKRKVLD